jgi:sugar/nucleoside kinase (ribokinase family)
MFVGHVSIDHVQNLRGTRVQAGGAALYAAMAAKTLTKNIALVSAIGKDYEFPDSLRLLNHDHVKRFNVPSTRFNIRYNKLEEAEYLKAMHGAGSRIRASAIPTRLLTPETIVHISPMRPSKVKKIVQRIQKSSPKTEISHNTWIDYIRKSRRNRGTLKDLAQQIDSFIVNDTEAKALAQTDSISAALRVLEAKRLVITLGQLGAIVKGENGGIQMVPALNVPVKNVVDTTGAGDTWCGAFVATYRLTRDLMKSVTIASVISSIKCSGWGLEKLIKLSFRRPDDVIEYVIGLKEGVLQKRILDYART